MKKILILLMLIAPMAAMAQSVWEKPDDGSETVEKQKKEKMKDTKPNPDAKYLAGAVTEVDGKVQWTLDVDVPEKSAEQIYDIMLKVLTDLTKTENQLEGSSVSLVNKQEHIIVAGIREWMVFTDKLLSLDRTKFHYTLISYCKDGHLTLTMGRISYRYGTSSSKTDTTYKAEEWINDENALNKKQTKLLPLSAKFRRKTIDRKDYLFETISEAVKK